MATLFDRSLIPSGTLDGNNEMLDFSPETRALVFLTLWLDIKLVNMGTAVVEEN